MARKLRPLLTLPTSCGLPGWRFKGLASSGQSINRSFLEFFCCYLFYDVHLIIVESMQIAISLVLCLKFEICSTAKFRADIPISYNYRLHLQTSKKKNPNLNIKQKHRKREAKAGLHKLMDSVQDFPQIRLELILLRKKAVSFKKLKTLGQELYLPMFPKFYSYFLHPFPFSFSMIDF